MAWTDITAEFRRRRARCGDERGGDGVEGLDILRRREMMERTVKKSEAELDDRKRIWNDEDRPVETGPTYCGGWQVEQVLSFEFAESFYEVSLLKGNIVDNMVHRRIWS